MELIVKDFSHLNLKDDKYLLDFNYFFLIISSDFNINLLQNVNCILNGKGTASCQRPGHILINKCEEFCQMLSLKQ